MCWVSFSIPAGAWGDCVAEGNLLSEGATKKQTTQIALRGRLRKIIYTTL